MKLILENIGKIKKAEIDLDHQLTVFFGPNNTGKTYVSYCLYGLNRMFAFGDEIEYIADIIDIDFNELIEKGGTKINLKASLLPKREALKTAYVKGFRNFLPTIFGNYEMDFSISKVSLSYFENDCDLEKIIDGARFEGKVIRYSNTKAFVEEENINGVLGIRLSSDFDSHFNDESEKKIVKKLVQKWVLRNIFKFGINAASFIAAERVGVSVFSKDILRKRFEVSNSPSDTDKFFPYSLVIQAAILQQESLTGVRARGNNEGVFSSIAIEIENQILGGTLSLNEAGDIFYGNKEIEILAISNSASTIKSLSSLVFYLRYYAHSGGILFIDEPEINLHPDNQRKIAKILAKISNLGIKVYVSTHSDYIIREFNNLIMLGKENEEKDRLVKEYGYKQEEVLDYKRVGAYNFNHEGLPEQIEVKETGFITESIDEVINAQNRASNDIMWTLFEA